MEVFATLSLSLHPYSDINLGWGRHVAVKFLTLISFRRTWSFPSREWHRACCWCCGFTSVPQLRKGLFPLSQPAETSVQVAAPSAPGGDWSCWKAIAFFCRSSVLVISSLLQVTLLPNALAGGRQRRHWAKSRTLHLFWWLSAGRSA